MARLVRERKRILSEAVNQPNVSRARQSSCHFREHFVEVDSHPVYTRARVIFEAGEGIGRDSVGF